jgi:hypothetical protein
VVLSGYTPVSSTTETGRHDIAEILLKVALNTKIKSNQIYIMKIFTALYDIVNFAKMVHLCVHLELL